MSIGQPRRQIQALCGLALSLLFLSPAAVSKIGDARVLPEGPGDGTPGYSIITGRALVPCQAHVPIWVRGRQLVLLIAGQSNGANFLGAGSAPYQPSTAVVNFNVYDGRCYATQEPLLGAGGLSGSFADRLADLAIKEGLADRIVLAPVALGGTAARDWAGVLFPRIAAAIDGLRAQGLEPDVVLWQQGETEAVTAGYAADLYRSIVRQIVEQIRKKLISAPFYVAVSTYCTERSKRNDWIIREAQRNLVDETMNIRLGPDTDQFVETYRNEVDHCHFNVRGADAVAHEWLKVLAPEPERKLSALH